MYVVIKDNAIEKVALSMADIGDDDIWTHVEIDYSCNKSAVFVNRFTVGLGISYDLWLSEDGYFITLS